MTKNQTASTRLRLNRRMLEEAYPEAIVKSLGGVYPDTEIHTATQRRNWCSARRITPRTPPEVHARPQSSQRAAPVANRAKM